MLSDDQNDQSERSESGADTPVAPPETASAAPVVTRRTRKAPAKKAAAAPEAPADTAEDQGAGEHKPDQERQQRIQGIRRHERLSSRTTPHAWQNHPPPASLSLRKG